MKDCYDTNLGTSVGESTLTSPQDFSDLNREWCGERLPCGLCRRTYTPCPYGVNHMEITC